MSNYEKFFEDLTKCESDEKTRKSNCNTAVRQESRKMSRIFQWIIGISTVLIYMRK
jgi:hypothetical protein